MPIKDAREEIGEDESVTFRYYSDHRRGDLDNYPTLCLCDWCAYELEGDLSRLSDAEEYAHRCDECGASNRWENPDFCRP